MYYFCLCKSKMSFLSILLVASAFYFADARPDAGTPDWTSKLITSEVLPYPDYHETANAEPKVEPSNNVDYEQMMALMTDFGKAMDVHLVPIMSKLPVPKQKEMKTMGMNGMASYMNYLYLLIQEFEHEKEEGVNSASHDGSQPRNEIILQFESPHPVEPEWPFIHDMPIHEETVAV